MYLVTGGAGFIGSALVRALVARGDDVVNVDKMTYAANPASLADIAADRHYHFEHADIADAAAMARVFGRYAPKAVLHLAAESHVDRSIDGAADFVTTNVVGTYTLLAEARRYWESLDADGRQAFRFVHVSTDEVFGSLGPGGTFSETSPYDPSSPYSATKAGSDHLARAWHRTFGLPVIVTNASNNFGPRQFPEKLIPLTLLNALAGRPIDVYGSGDNVRDWLFVEDHVDALLAVLERGRVGATYTVGAASEQRNLDVVHAVCDIADELIPPPDGESRRRLIRFVRDRPGHDFRYALDASTTRNELGWAPRHTFRDALTATVRWYLDHRDWWAPVWRQPAAGARIGLGTRA